MKFAVQKKEYAKIEKQDKINFSVIGYKNKNPNPVYTSKLTFETHVDLLQY